MKFSDREVTGYMIGSSIAATIGFVLMMFARLEQPPDWFWHEYVVALGGTGAMLLIFGLIWLVLAIGARHSNFFDLKRPMDAQVFGLTMLTIAVAVIVALALVVPLVPKTPTNSLPPDPAARASILRMDANFRLVVSALILVTGFAVASVPYRRFIQK